MFNIIKYFINLSFLYRYVYFKLKFRVKKNPELLYRFIKVNKLYPEVFRFYRNYFLTGGFIPVEILKFVFFWVEYKGITLLLI